MSTETMKPELDAQVYYLRKKVDEIVTTLKEQGTLLAQAAISRERTSNEIHQIQQTLHDLKEADRELRSSINQAQAPAQPDPPLHPAVVEETSNRSRMWAAIAAFFTAVAGWAAGWFSSR